MALTRIAITWVSALFSPLGSLSWDDPLIQFLLTIIRALAVLAITLLLSRFIRRWIVRLFGRGRINLNLATLLANVLQVLVLALGIIYILRELGVDWAGLLTVLGAAGLAISLSMQDLLKNVIAGVYILLEQPFKIGDRITVKEVTGTVQGIELRTTILCTDDDLQVVVPNSTVLNEIVTNRSASNLQKQALLLYTTRTDLDGINKDITQTLRNFDAIASSPAPLVTLEEIKDNTSRLRVEFWVKAGRRVEVVSQVAEALRESFPNASLSLV
jgi:small conductance mechanosensitive channel